MSDEVDVLRQRLSNGSLDECDAMVRGIAQLAMDQGFNNLTTRQQAVLRPHLTQECAGLQIQAATTTTVMCFLRARSWRLR